MKSLVLLALLPILAQTGFPSSNTAAATKQVRFTVIDPLGNPVAGALVEASRHGPGNVSGRTGSDGSLSLILNKAASLHVNVSMSGYYDTGGELWTGGMHMGPDRRLVVRELPNQFTIELKPVMNPVHLRHLNYRGNAPRSAQPIGFDLEAGDWIHPYGNGTRVDIYFYFHEILVSASGYEGSLTVSFPHPKDGIQSFFAPRAHSREFGSNLTPPNVAPVNGYVPSLSHSLRHREGEPYQDYKVKRRNYLFRTRSRTDAMGQLREACYGWIEGEIEFDPRDPKGPQLSFSYYFNANPDPEARSLESVDRVSGEL